MSKKYKDKICAYCAEKQSSTADHVFAKSFFIRADRAGLPMVPACYSCNTKKSFLENYAATVLPFGGRHGSAKVNLTENVKNRLKNNKKLCDSLKHYKTPHYEALQSGIVVPVRAINVDPARICSWLEYVGRGLVLFHFGRVVGKSDVVRVIIINHKFEGVFLKFFELRNSGSVENNLGKSTFIYQGARACDNERITIWKLKIYGGAVFGDKSSHGSTVGIVTVPKELGSEVDRLFASRY